MILVVSQSQIVIELVVTKGNANILIQEQGCEELMSLSYSIYNKQQANSIDISSHVKDTQGQLIKWTDSWTTKEFSVSLDGVCIFIYAKFFYDC